MNNFVGSLFDPKIKMMANLHGMPCYNQVGINALVIEIRITFLPTFAIMNIIRSWREQKILLKRRFPFLSDEDFLFEEGKRENMLTRLQEKLGKTSSELELIFAEIQRS